MSNIESLIVSWDTPLLFCSQQQFLNVIIDGEKKNIVAATGEVELIPATVARFTRGIYETLNEETAILMIKRLMRDRRNRIPSSFFVHPAHIEQAKELCIKYFGAQEMSPEQILNIKTREIIEDAPTHPLLEKKGIETTPSGVTNEAVMTRMQDLETQNLMILNKLNELTGTQEKKPTSKQKKVAAAAVVEAEAPLQEALNEAETVAEAPQAEVINDPSADLFPKDASTGAQAAPSVF